MRDVLAVAMAMVCVTALAAATILAWGGNHAVAGYDVGLAVLAYLTTRDVAKRTIREESSGLWIYPGERRPIIVQAASVEAARKLVEIAPNYDGFGSWNTMTVELFEAKCRRGEAH